MNTKFEEGNSNSSQDIPIYGFLRKFWQKKKEKLNFDHFGIGSEKFPDKDFVELEILFPHI